MGHEKLTKREFIKQAALAAGVIGCGFSPLGYQTKGMNGYFNFSPTVLPPEIDKHTVEAKYYINTPKGLKCQLCPNECKIKENEEGECRTRVNIKGKLFCFAYGNPCAIHIDPVEKKPLYHFQPGTDTFSIATAGCNLACLNCQNWEISQTSPKKTRNYELFPQEVVNQCLSNNCKSIAYTYTDPIVFYEYVYDSAIIAKENNVKNILVSAGYINERPLREWCKIIDAANIDLKSFSNEIYEMLNAGKLEPVLNTLKILKEESAWLEITNLVVPSWTDDMDMIKKMCDWLLVNGFAEYPLHFSRFSPLYKLSHLSATPISTLNNARQIAINAGLKYVYIGNVPGSDASNTYCPKCNKIVINRIGYRINGFHILNGKCAFCNAKINGVWN
ncbi:MAG: AmmeMemoRadiSam system radical SAM enzyme [Bacteroidales bacterium]